MFPLNGKHIVVTFLMHLGDVVLTTPFLQVLRRAAPNSTITYVVDEKLKDVVQYNPNIDHVITVDKKGRDNSIGALYRKGKEISLERPDIVINLHPNERTSFLAWAIHAPCTVGVSHFLFRPFLQQYTKLDRKTMHAAAMYKDVLAQLGVTDMSDYGLEMKLSEPWEMKAQTFYKEHGLHEDDVLIGFNVGSAVVEKRWPPKRFAVVADYCIEKGYKTIFFGAQSELSLVEEVISHMQHSPIVGTGKFTIGELGAALRRCTLLVTNDSGPMHIAVSQNVPIVALYGPSNPKFYGPYTKDAIVIESMKEYDENKNMKQIIKEGNYKGLSVIDTETVINSIDDLLRKTM